MQEHQVERLRLKTFLDDSGLGMSGRVITRYGIVGVEARAFSCEMDFSYLGEYRKSGSVKVSFDLNGLPDESELLGCATEFALETIGLIMEKIETLEVGS